MKPARAATLQNVHLLELTEHVPHRSHVFKTDAGARFGLLVKGVEKPVTRWPHRCHRSKGCRCQEFSTVHVRSPQVGDSFHGNGERRVVDEGALGGTALTEAEVVRSDPVAN